MYNLEKRIVKLLENYDTYSYQDAYCFDDDYQNAIEDTAQLISEKDEGLLEHIQEMYEWYKGDGYDEELEQEALEILTILKRIYA